MLTALGCRGPDSAGVAIYGSGAGDVLKLRIKLGERGAFEEKGRKVAEQLRECGMIKESSVTGAYLHALLEPRVSARDVERFIESLAPGLEVVSLGRRLEIVKQVGSPQDLEAAYGISRFRGTHGIGHTRLCTESRVDLSHSQPFWAHGAPDLATAHNGHITNYHTLRRRYEQHGVRFYTENDSEVIGVYLADQCSKGMALEEAMKASLKDLDGSFSYVVATADALGFVKDPFALKPLIVAENDAFVAIATEEIAIRAAFGSEADAREAQARELKLWRA
ncbi:MAG: glutamine phosphoribosylpyrophosphate amidotransferase [Planctomycetes bacterium]|nr:glutamine phosphoribosylpyrophosphate amidotransferase [Planctomycetota bacterium]